MIDRTPKVFISYSWTSKEYRARVIALAERMRHDGVDVVIDAWDLCDGNDKYKFMERCVTDESIDKVIILSDKAYSEKADKRQGGVGDETYIISAEIYGKADQNKFIPVVMERGTDGEAYLPAYLKPRIYRDLSGENYEAEYEELLRTIYEAPSHRKPELGERPKWLVEDKPDALYPVKEAVKKITLSDLGRSKAISVHDFIDIYVEALKPYYDVNIDKEKYLRYFTEMKEYRNVFLDHLREFSEMESFGAVMADEFERLYNALFSVDTFSPGTYTCDYLEFDLFRVHIWELFVCTTVYMLHNDMYKDIHDLLVRTYFLRRSPLNYGSLEPSSYVRFRFHSKMIEEVIKPGMPGDLSRKYTLTGHFVVTDRLYMPVYSERAMATADLFLYQVYNALGLNEMAGEHAWFPIMYVYADRYESMWKKLISKQFCNKIMPLFGVTTISELKARISKCLPNKDYHYSGEWGVCASNILSWVKLEDIATLP